MKYVDGFVLVIPKKNFNSYKKMAIEGKNIWKKFGALGYFECVGEDLNPKMQGMSSLTFPKLTKLKNNEDVWFSFIIYKNKKHRDNVNKKVMDYFNKKYNGKEMKMPFDMKKFSTGGFKVIVEK